MYDVVGLTRGMVGTGGDGLAFFTVSDAMAVQFDLPGEATRLERASRLARLVNLDLGRVMPLLSERVVGPVSGLPALGPPQVSAVLVTLQHGVQPDRGRGHARNVARCDGLFERKRRSTCCSRGWWTGRGGSWDCSARLLIIISTIIMALILYTLTLDKIHDIALLKLIGARNSVIIGLIVQQALLMGTLGYGLAWWLGQYAFPRFPRLVLIERPDLAMLAGIVLAISVLASLLGIWKAMGVEPNKVLA